MKFQSGMKSSNFPYNQHFFQPGMKIWYYARANSLFIFKKLKMAILRACFKKTDSKRSQEFKYSMEFRNGDSNTDRVKLYESVRKSLNRYI